MAQTTIAISVLPELKKAAGEKARELHFMSLSEYMRGLLIRDLEEGKRI